MDEALSELASRVKERVPSLHYSVQQGGNNSFPWWVVARFRSGSNETKAVDASIDSRGTSQAWSVRTDVACEDGLVLDELPALNGVGSENGGPSAGQEEVIRQVEHFLARQAECIVPELS